MTYLHRQFNIFLKSETWGLTGNILLLILWISIMQNTCCGGRERVWAKLLFCLHNTCWNKPSPILLKGWGPEQTKPNFPHASLGQIRARQYSSYLSYFLVNAFQNVYTSSNYDTLCISAQKIGTSHRGTHLLVLWYNQLFSPELGVHGGIMVCFGSF
jgi:hypothetical protein